MFVFLIMLPFGVCCVGGRLPNTGRIVGETVDKSRALVKFSGRGHTPGLRHRPVSTWVAVGNDANDVAMIRAADIGVIVGDGLEEVRARRRTVRVPSRPGAVVSILEQLLELHH